MKTERPPFVVRAARSLRQAWRELTDPMVTTGFGGPYKGAEVSRLYMDWIASLMSPDDEMRMSLRRMRARGREVARNTPQGSKFIEMLAVNIVGPNGFACKPQFRDEKGELVEKVNDAIEEAWYRWADEPVSLDGRQCLTEYLQLQAKTWGQDGETFTRKWVDFDERPLAIEAIDADLVDDTYSAPATRNSNEVRLGVEVDQYGRRQAYHVLNDISLYSSDRKRERVLADRVVHAYVLRRPNQTRGVTLFAPILWALKQLSGYMEAELISSRAGAGKMGVITQDENAASIDADKFGKFNFNMNPGTVELLAKGLKFESFDPQHPTNAFPFFVKTILRDVSSGLNVNYNALANDGEGISWSTLRTFENREHDDWRVAQFLWTQMFLKPIYEAWLEAAIMRGDLKLGSYDWRRFKAVTWMPRGWKWVDPPKDIEYAERAIALGLGSRERFAAEMGLDFYQLLEERKREEAAAKAAGISIAGLGPKPAAPAPTNDGEGDDGDKSLTNGHGKNRIAEILGGTQ